MKTGAARIVVVVLALSATISCTSARKLLESDDGGLAALTQPAVEGVANPLTTGLGRGVAGAAEGTHQTADLSGDVVAALLHTVGQLIANIEQGAGVSAANAGNAVQGTVEEIPDDD